MDNEKRSSRRLDLDVAIELERLDQGSTSTITILHADVTNMSGSGIGFISDKPFEIGSCYNTRIQIWTKEIIPTVIKIVRCAPNEDGTYNCGCTFVGLRESEILKINIYQMLNTEED